LTCEKQLIVLMHFMSL